MDGKHLLRVCLVEGWWNPEQKSMPLYCRETKRLLEGTGVEVVQVRPRAHGPIPLSAPYHRLARRWAQWVDLPLQLGRVRADVFHCLEPADVSAARHVGPERTVVTCHDLIPWRLRHMQRAGWRARLGVTDFFYRSMWQKLRRVARIVTPSERTKQDILEYAGIPAARVEVIPYWLNPAFHPRDPEVRASVRRRLAECRRIPDGFWFLHVGTVDFYKNIEGLLEALAKLRRASPGASFSLLRVGSRLPHSQAALARRLSLSDRVIELGNLDLESLAEVYICSDALVFPSWYEGFGRPPLEAMASGLPVIAGNRGAVPEVVGQAALQVDPSDTEALVLAMQRLMQNPLLCRQLIEAGIRRAQAHRLLDVQAKLLRVYREVARAAG